MADTFTTQLNLTKVGIGESEDTWGTKLNDNFDDVDALFDAGPYLKIANGGTGAGTAANARTSLGIGSLALQAADAVAITGGTATLSSVTLTSGTPSPWLFYRDTDLAVDASGLWAVGAGNGVFYVQKNTAAGGDFATADTVISATSSTFTHMGNTVWHAGNDGAGSTLDADLLDGNQGAFYQDASNLNAGSIPNARVPASAVTQHQSALTITETQITDGSVLARLSANETVTGAWTFSAVGTITRSGQGRFTYLNGSGNTGGAITVSTADPSGTPANGDFWVKYIA